MILRKHRLGFLASDVHPFAEREDVGRTLTLEEVNKTLEIAIANRSRSLFRVWCRLHDLRPIFSGALGEAGGAESTMKAIAGWMSAKRLERYSHTRNQARRDAVNKLPRRRPK